LGVDGEVNWLVPTLVLPSRREHAAGSIEDVEAVQLFIERARAANAAFAPPDRDAKTVAEICRAVDGIPLALELRLPGCAWCPLARSQTGCGIASTCYRAMRVRSCRATRTMSATMEWSYDLLSDVERDLLDQLSVFRGGWTIDAAEDVSDGRGTFESLARLVDQSLVLAESDSAGDMRYRLLEPVRQFAEERLDSSGMATLVRDRHAGYFLGLAERAQVALWGVNQRGSWIPRLAREHDKLRAALRWLIDTGDADRAQLVGAYLGRYWMSVVTFARRACGCQNSWRCLRAQASANGPEHAC
jgi:predicted ATPase